MVNQKTGRKDPNSERSCEIIHLEVKQKKRNEKVKKTYINIGILSGETIFTS